MEKLESYFKQLAEHKEPANLYNPIYYTLSQGGKRIRPRLVFLSTELFGGDIEKAVYPAAAFEMLHNFTLIHDDIMDRAPLRRGRPTVYKEWNTSTAILAGDALATMAIKEILQTPADCRTVIDLSRLLAETSVEICEGQQKDLDFETSDRVTIEDFLKMIRYKTAVMLAGCLKAGAILSHTSETNQLAVYNYGIHIGLAFQLKDDLLDVYADHAEFGKAIGGDIQDNKKTYLFLRALQDGTPEQQKELLYYFSGESFDAQKKFNAVTAIYEQLQIKSKTELLIEEYVQKSLSELDKITIDDSQKKEIFKQLAIELSSRKK